MKKFTKVSMIAALSASALTPVIGFAAENDVVAEHATPGLYNVQTGQVISITEFQFYPLEQKLEILKNGDFYLANGEGKVLKLTYILTAEDDDALDAAFEDETVVEAELGIELSAEGTITKDGVNLVLVNAIVAAEAAITALPAVDALTLDDKEAVEAAQALVDAVTALDKDAVVTNLEVLVAAQDKIAELENVEVGLTVESVSAINATSVKVTFNKEVETLAEADVTASNKATGEKQYVKSVELAEDGKSATVTFYEALKSGATYTVAVKDAGSADLEFVMGVPTTIEVETAQTAKATVAYAVKYKVLDENGLDITATTKVKYESNVTVTDGEVTLAKDATAFVYITALDKDGKAIANTKTAKITVTGQEAKAVKLIASSIEAGVDKADFEDKDFKADHTLRLGETPTLTLFVEDQFGDKDVAADVTFESLDRTVAIVDRTTGDITPLKAGKVAVRVTVGDVKQIVELTVEKAAVVDSIKVDKAEFSISDKLSTGQAVKVTAKDQYGETNESATGPVKAEIKSGTGLVTVDASVNAAQGVATFTVKPVAGKEGTAVIEFSYDVTVDGKTTTFTDSTTVTVTKAGTIADYTVEGFEAELDKYEGADAKNTTEMALTVFGTDANGVKVGNALADGYDVTVKDADGKTVAGDLDAQNNTNLKADGTYTVEVTVGSLTVFTETFTVVDTTPAADKTVVKFTASSVSDVNADLDLFDELLGAIKVTTGTDEETIEGVTFTSDNSSVIASDSAATALNVKTQGEAYLTIQSVTLASGEVIAVDNVEIKAVIDYSKVKYADVENAVAGAVTVHTVLDTEDAEVTGNYANGVLTIEHDFAKLTEELGGAPSVAKWVGAHIAGPQGAVKAAVLNVEGTDPRSFKDVAVETEAGFTDGFFYFFPALEAGNTNNLTIAWSDANGKVIKVEKLQVKYINSNTP